MGWRVEPRKRGEAVAVTVKGLPELPEGVRAAACTQAVYERGLHRVPVAAPVDSCHLRTLLRGLPDSLKMFVPSLRERIQAAIDRNQQNPQTPPPSRARFDLGGDVTQYSLGRSGGWRGREREGPTGLSQTPARPALAAGIPNPPETDL